MKITASNIEAAIALAEPIPESASASYQATTLEFSAKEPSRFAKMFNSGDGITVTVDPSIPDMTHLVEKARIVDFVGFAWPELALPWFVRLHAAATGVDALAPVVVTRNVKSPMRPEHHDIEDLDDLIDDVQESTLSDSLKQRAYGEWQTRAAERPD